MLTTKSLDKSKCLQVINDFFKECQVWCGPAARVPSVSEIEKHLSKNFQLYNNGHLVARSAVNYLERLQKFQKKYSSFKISQPIEEPLILDNQVAMYYQLDLTTKTNQHKTVYIMGLGTIEDNKISKWVEVTNEKGAGNWDS